jgi:palmitoyltransferase
MNPWDLGRAYLNFKAVFGERLHDWLLPLKHSPCCDHSSQISQFPLGPDFKQLLIEAGLAARPSSQDAKSDLYDFSGSTASQRKRKRRRKLDAGWQHGERPDGWISEKEARRQRKEARRVNGIG